MSDLLVQAALETGGYDYMPTLPPLDKYKSNLPAKVIPNTHRINEGN